VRRFWNHTWTWPNITLLVHVVFSAICNKSHYSITLHTQQRCRWTFLVCRHYRLVLGWVRRCRYGCEWV